MARKSIIIIFSVLFIQYSFGQNRQRVDSLLNKLNTAWHDTTKLKLLQGLTNEFFYSDFDSVVVYNDQLKKIADKNNDKFHIAAYYNNLGIAYLIKENFTKSLEKFLAALKINEKIKNEAGIIQNCYNIAFLYDLTGKKELQAKYQSKALNTALKSGDKHAIANCYIDLFQTSLKDHKLKKAEEYIKKAEICYKELLNQPNRANYGSELGVLYSNFGMLYSEQGKYTLSNLYFLKAINIFNKDGQSKMVADTYYNMAETNRKNGNIKLAIEYAEKSIKIAQEIHSLDLISTNANFLYNIYRNHGDSKKALDYYIQFSEAQDSLFTIESEKTLLELNEKYQTEKKEQQLKINAKDLKLKEQRIKLKDEVITNKNYLIYGISFFVLFSVIITLLLILRWRYKTRLNTIWLKQKLLRSQMNPHFIFNALSSIQGSVLENKTTEAADYIADFAALTRLILDSSMENSISINHEIQILSNYLKLQQLRYENLFDFNIEIDDYLEASSAKIPPMLAQPFIENAIEHGIINKCHKGMIDIRFLLENNEIVFIVDNYCIEKMQESTVRNKIILDHKPVATELTKERLLYLNKENPGTIHFEFKEFFDHSVSPAIEKTRVSFKIPFERD